MGGGVTKGVGDGVRSGLSDGRTEPDGLAVGKRKVGDGVISGDGVKDGDADGDGEGDSVGSTAIGESVGSPAGGRLKNTRAKAPPAITTPASTTTSKARMPCPMPKPPAC